VFIGILNKQKRLQ